MTGASVCLVRDNGEFETLYEYIDSAEKADLLAQLAMHTHGHKGLIIVFPGYNRSIAKDNEEYIKALKLAEEFKADGKRYGTLKKNCIENARKWLIENIKNKTNRFDFQILKETENNNCYYFDCKYKWSLNGWVKDIHSEIIVIYNEKTGQFVSPEIPV